MPNTPATWLDAVTVNAAPADKHATVQGKGDILIGGAPTDYPNSSRSRS